MPKPGEVHTDIPKFVHPEGCRNRRQAHEPGRRSIMIDISGKEGCPRHKISVCSSPMCNVAGQDRLVEKLEEILGVSCGHVSNDGLFFLERVDCQGYCELAPLLIADGVAYPEIQLDDITGLLNSFRLSSV